MPMPPADPAQDLETVRALFDGGRLTQARQLAGLLKADVAAQVGVTAAAVGQFEGGVARPSSATLGKLALALGVPTRFFAADRPRFSVSEDEAHFRSLRSTSKRDRARARAQVELLAQLVHTLERQLRLPVVDLPPLDPTTSPDEAARAVRLAWDLGDGPVLDVVGLLERRGVIIARLSAATDELDAFSCWIGDRPFIVLVANKEAADRARFDSAHELAHLLLHHDAQPGDPDLERAAHRFAAEFLAPSTSILPLLPRRVDWRRLAELKLHWGVSMSMLLRRMRDLGVISDAAYRRGMMDMSRRGWRRAEPVVLGEPEQPELLTRAVGLLTAERGYGLDELANEMALRPESLASFVVALTSVPRAEVTL
jgi:Zn-dependent peptidase ImmA (M78 family)/transcriptional regulator with XRE-family HTH domain